MQAPASSNITHTVFAALNFSSSSSCIAIFAILRSFSERVIMSNSSSLPITVESLELSKTRGPP